MADNVSVSGAETLRQMALSPRTQLDLANQQIFINHVEDIRKTEVHHIPDLVSYLPNDDSYSDVVDELFYHQGDQTYLSDAFAEYVNQDNFPDRLTFNVQKVLRMGKEDSRRSVFFGALQASWFHEADKLSQQVAVTPIPANEFTRRMALHEIGRYQQLGRLGISTLEVLGVTLFDEPKSDLSGFFATKLVPDLNTMDNLPWDEMMKAEQAKYMTMALDMTATLHSEMIFHGDTKFKNISFSEAQGDFVVSDIEFSRSLRDVPERVRLIAQRMRADLGFIEESVSKFILPTFSLQERPRGEVARFNFMHNYLYEPYFERIISINGQFVDVLAKAYEVVVNDRGARAHSGEVPRPLN